MGNNKNYKVVLFVGISFSIYMLFSVYSAYTGDKYEVFSKINLVSDIYIKKEKQENKVVKDSVYKPVLLSQDFNLYKKPEYITNFYVGDSICALPKLAEKLRILKATGKGKIRIAYFGDSMIEGDLLTQTFRKLLQQEFGGSGVGFLPLNSNVAKNRQTAYTQASGWNMEHFMMKNATNLYMSGYAFRGMGKGFYRDNTILDKDTRIEKSIIFGKIDNAQISVNGIGLPISGKNLVNRKSVINDYSNELRIQSHTDGLRLYGISFESENGVFVDNFSFRGITGVELRRIDEDFFKAIQVENPYDLIIFQYGINLLYKPTTTDYSYYGKMMNPVFEKMKKVFPDTEFLIISTTDRAFRYDGEYRSAKGIYSLIETQAKLAITHNFAFYNQFESMGGENSIVEWVKQNPPLANKDYIHPNHKGAEVLANKIFTALMNDYKNKK